MMEAKEKQLMDSIRAERKSLGIESKKGIKSQEKKSLSKNEIQGIDCLSMESFAFCHETGSYYLRVRDEFEKREESQFKRDVLFMAMGRDFKAQDREQNQDLMAEIERFLHDIRMNRCVDMAGHCSGYKIGIQTVNRKRFLNVREVILAEPKRGDCSHIQFYFESLLGMDQVQLFYGWLQVFLKGFYGGEQRHGQIMVLAGEVGCGKSMGLKILKWITGEAYYQPYRIAIAPANDGRFNRELCESTLLVIDDEISAGSEAVRVRFESWLKSTNYGGGVILEKKGVDGFPVLPYFRTVIATNLEADKLGGLPKMGDDISDKFLLFKCNQVKFPHNGGDEERKFYDEALKSQVPAFVDFILNHHTVKETDIDFRFGVRAFLHPEVLELIEGTSAEMDLMEYIDKVLFEGNPPSVGMFNVRTEDEYWTGTAGELCGHMRATLGDRLVDQFARSDRRMGRLLSNISNMSGFKNRVIQDRKMDARKWIIFKGKIS